jgi:hypothetical protein
MSRKGNQKGSNRNYTFGIANDNRRPLTCRGKLQRVQNFVQQTFATVDPKWVLTLRTTRTTQIGRKYEIVKPALFRFRSSTPFRNAPFTSAISSGVGAAYFGISSPSTKGKINTQRFRFGSKRFRSYEYTQLGLLRGKNLSAGGPSDFSGRTWWFSARWRKNSFVDLLFLTLSRT